MHKWVAGLAVASIIGISGNVGAQTPKMTAAQAKLLYAAGGFPISADGKNPTDRCGKAANPRITFVDMNGDGRKEALFIDSGACYKPDGRWYAVATQNADGSWRKVLDGQGSVQAVGTQINGWFVLSTTSGGKSEQVAYNGQTYVPKAALTAAAPAGKAATSTAAAAPAPAPAAATGDAGIFGAAGFKQIKGKWESGCNDPSAGAPYDPGRIERVGDLNGDGRPEAMVIEGGSYCYGNTGEAFWIVSQQASGGWKLIYNEIGIAEFLKTKGVGGWPDISVGGPGFCFPVVRWNGSEYALNRFQYEGKACKRPSP